MKRDLKIMLSVDKTSIYNNFNDFDEIKKLLEQHGVFINFDTDNHNVLSIFVNESELKRNAGRKAKLEYTENGILRLSEIEKMQETMTDTEIISQLNMSRATFYRRLKKAKANKKPNYDPLF